MNNSLKFLLIFLGGAAAGSLATAALCRHDGVGRKAFKSLVAGGIELKEKALGAVERAREEMGDLVAEVEHEREAKAAQGEGAA